MRIGVTRLFSLFRTSIPFAEFALLLLVAFSMHARSEEQNYYQASVPVKSQDAYTRKAAAVEAFAEVIVRVSGSAEALKNPVIREAHGDAITYVEQFQYSPLQDDELRQQGYSENLNLTFSAPAIERLLREKAQQPFWPVSRPETLVWLVEDSLNGGKQFVSADFSPEVVGGFDSTARKRGLPLKYPLLDLQDQTHLSPEDVWVLNEQAILAASERYRADVILVGRFSTTSSGEYLATWQYFHRGDTRVYDSRVESAFELGFSALNPLANYLGHRYAILPSTEARSALVLQLSGITGFRAYRHALDYLENIAAISQVFVAGVRQDMLLLQLQSDASVEKFVGVLSLDNRIKKQDSVASGDLPVWQQVPMGTLENPLRYRWLK